MQCIYGLDVIMVILYFYILLNYYAGRCDSYFCLTQGSSSTEIVFEVAADGTPELAEEYLLSLTAVETLSEDISELGRAQLDSDATMATISLRASDNPHGVVEFQELSVEAESDESSPVVLTIVREFGSIGKHFTFVHSVCEVSCFTVSVKCPEFCEMSCLIYASGALDVEYEAVMGNLGTLGENTSLATPGLDFTTSTMTVTLEDGQLSATIAAPIIDVSLSLQTSIFLIDSQKRNRLSLSC